LPEDGQYQLWTKNGIHKFKTFEIQASSSLNIQDQDMKASSLQQFEDETPIQYPNNAARGSLLAQMIASYYIK
jgi:hypothetical protein